MSRRATIGIHIGGTKTLVALFNDRFDVVEEIKIKTQADKGEKAFGSNLAAAIENLRETLRKKRMSLDGVGVGCAGSWIRQQER